LLTKENLMTQMQLSAKLISEIARTLKSARETKKEEMADIAYRIALSPSQLRAIESENTAPFYSHHYFLQAAQRYAEALNITLPTETESVQAPVQRILPAENTPAAEPAATVIPTAKPAAMTAATPAANTTYQTAPAAATPFKTDSAANSSFIDTPPKKQRQSVVEKKPLRWAWVGFASLIAILLGVIKIGLQESPQTLVAQAPAPKSLANSPAAPAIAAASPSVVTPPETAPQKSAPAATASPATASSATTTFAEATAAAAAAPTTRVFVNGETDSYVRSKAATWLQIVATNGEKTNLRIGPDEQIDFNAAKTAAVVFGKPDAASVYVRGNRINLEPFIEDPDRRRALVIMREVR
jgi:transcriptional regulator with XRE-family HTH domain